MSHYPLVAGMFSRFSLGSQVIFFPAAEQRTPPSGYCLNWSTETLRPDHVKNGDDSGSLLALLKRIQKRRCSLLMEKWMSHLKCSKYARTVGEDVIWQTEVVVTSAALAVEINWNGKVSGVVFYLTFSYELVKATTRYSGLFCNRLWENGFSLDQQLQDWGTNSPPSGAAFMYLGMELPLGPNLVLQPFSFFNLGLETFLS